MKQISIVIVTYNSTKDIQGCLKSVYENNDLGDDLEVIVVDNNSNDIDTLKDILTTDFPQVMLIENSKNGGYGQGNNMGIRQSTAPVIMIMNPDVRLFMPVFKRTLYQFSNKPNLAMLGFCQYESIGKRGNSFMPLGHYLTTFIRYLFYKKIDRFNSKYLKISGACFFIRKSHFEQVGLFDENLFMYGEEYDLNIRLRKASYEIEFDNTIGYIHPVHERVGSLKSEEIEYRSFLYTRKKHGGNIKRELRHTILYLQLMKIRAMLKKNSQSLSFYDDSIRFYKEKINHEL